MPDRPRLVVVNATPILALALIDQLDLLHSLYERIVIPSAVQAEISAGGTAGIGVRELREATWKARLIRLKEPHILRCRLPDAKPDLMVKTLLLVGRAKIHFERKRQRRLPVCGASHQIRLSH